jgi:spore coat polysaccharide biosynthesis protein SpsF (cytidylyltransferase family)
MGSSRLPGKVLEPLGAKTALARCLDRCAAIPGVDEVVCVVPEGPADNSVAHTAARAGARVVRGPEHDVLARYVKGAREANADIVMRVTSDCPFIDPAVCGATRDLLIETGADYATNAARPLFPHGLDCDVFPAEQLYRADREASSAYDREHVTTWLRAAPDVVRVALDGPGLGFQRLRWTLDYPEDLALARAIYEGLGEAAATVDWKSLAAFCLGRPDLTALVEHRIDEARLAPARPMQVRFAKAA